MQTIKVNDFENKKGLNMKKRLGNYWKTLKKNNLQYLFLIILLQWINLIVMLWLFPYIWGIVVHIIILGILFSVLIFKWLRRPKFIQFVTIIIIPTVLLTFIIVVLLMLFNPQPKFPETWTLSDNNASRMATINKFRVNQIELQFPVTFKTDIDSLRKHVEKWINDNGFNYATHNLTTTSN